MLRVCWAVSGEVLATLDPDEVEGKTVKSLKIHVGKQIGATRFQQRWFEDQSELDDEAVPPCYVQLVVLNHLHREKWQAARLISACDENRWAEVEALLKMPLDPDITNRHGQTAIQAAAIAGSEQCLVLLLEAGAASDKVKHHNGLAALALAARSGHPKIVQLLLEAGADKDQAARRGQTALHLAALNGHPEVARLLLESRVDTEKETCCAYTGCYTALHLAAREGHSEVVRLLLESRVDTEKEACCAYRGCYTALHLAAREGHSEVVRLLLESRVDTEKETCCAYTGCYTALHLAAREGHSEVVRLLLESRVDKEDVTEQLSIALHDANGHPEVVELLIQHGASAEVPSPEIRMHEVLHWLLVATRKLWRQ